MFLNVSSPDHLESILQGWDHIVFSRVELVEHIEYLCDLTLIAL